MKRHCLSRANKGKDRYIAVPEAPVKVRPANPLDAVIQIESRRMRLGIKKNVLCAKAEIKSEMYSYVLKRGRNNESLPDECMGKIRRALDWFEKNIPKKRSA